MPFVAKRKMKLESGTVMPEVPIPEFTSYPEKVQKRLLGMGWVKEVPEAPKRRGRPPGSKVNK